MLLLVIAIAGTLVLIAATSRIELSPMPTFDPVGGHVAATVFVAVCAAALFFGVTDGVLRRPRVWDSGAWAAAAAVGLFSWAAKAELRHDAYLAERRAFRRATVDFGAGRYDSALEECGMALATAPDPDAGLQTERERELTRSVWNGKGLALRKPGRADEAVAAYGEALRFGKDPQVLNNRAVAGLSLRRLDRAADDLDEAIRLAPDDPLLRLHRDLAWRKAGDPNRARASFEKALALRPGWDRAERELARLGE